VSTQVLFALLGTLALAGAALVVWTRDVTRIALGLGVFLLAVAGLFALFGFGFLALAELFVYVGGVLVIVLFAIMLVHRSQPGEPSLSIRHDPLAAVACAGVFGFLVLAFRPLGMSLDIATGTGTDQLADLLLGSMLPVFELAGVLLLAALIAIVAIVGGERE
jgi:NADH-quinone oxidoreductase subunit J